MSAGLCVTWDGTGRADLQEPTPLNTCASVQMSIMQNGALCVMGSGILRGGGGAAWCIMWVLANVWLLCVCVGGGARIQG